MNKDIGAAMLAAVPPPPGSRERRQSERDRVAIEINALRVAEIATLRHECAFWRERCLLLEAVVNRPAHQLAGPVHDGNAKGGAGLRGTAPTAEKP